MPDGYTPEDQPHIIRYTTINGPNGPLLQSVPAYSAAADAAQHRLLAKLQEYEQEVVAKYHRAQAPVSDDYFVHDAKFNAALLSYLERRQLAWRSKHANPFGNRNWYALHPVLGSAVMTTIGLTIARSQELDIVTPSHNFHDALLATEESAIFDTLLKHTDASTITKEQRRFDLSQLVIALGINTAALRPEDIPSLQASAHFQDFQFLIRDTALSIPRHAHPEDYKDKLTAQAQKIVHAWHQTQADVGGDVKKALKVAALTLTAEAIKQYFGQQFDVKELILEGIIGIYCYRGTQAIDKTDDAPYQYLTEVQQAEQHTLRGTFPLGTA